MKSILNTWPDITFIVLTALLSVVPYFFILQSGTTDSSWTNVLMWTPAFAAIILRLIRRESLFRGIGWNIARHLPWILLAALVPLLLQITTIAIAVVFDFAKWNESYIVVSGGLISIKKTALLFGASNQHIVLFVVNYLLSFWVGTLLYMLGLGLGEEYGWRGYLQAHLTGRYGLYKGMVILGLVWGYWHLPGILLGHNYPEYPILGGLVLMPVMTTIFSLVFGLLYIRLGNIWIPAILHASVNLSAGIANKALVKEGQNALAIDLTWMMLWLFIAALFVFMNIRREKNVPVRLQ